MARKPLQACILLGVEPELDCAAPVTMANALKAAEFVVALSAFQTFAIDYANVILPIAPFTETAGTFINTEGTVQKFNGVVKPLGEARPAWKVIRVLGNMLGLDGFEQDNVDAIRNEIAPDLQAFVNTKLNNEIRGAVITLPTAATGIERVAEVPIYGADALVRRAPSLQKSADARNAKIAFLASDVFANLGLSDAADVRIVQGTGASILKAKCDTTLPSGCVRVALAIAETSSLDAAFGAVTVERISLAAAAD